MAGLLAGIQAAVRPHLAGGWCWARPARAVCLGAEALGPRARSVGLLPSSSRCKASLLRVVYFGPSLVWPRASAARPLGLCQIGGPAAVFLLPAWVPVGPAGLCRVAYWAWVDRLACCCFSHVSGVSGPSGAVGFG